jgi:hypothetical protein
MNKQSFSMKKQSFSTNKQSFSMKKTNLLVPLLLFIFAILLSKNVFAQENARDIYIINLQNQNGTITFQSLSKQKAYLPKTIGENKTGYSVIFLDKENNKLYTTYFGTKVIVHTDTVEPGGQFKGTYQESTASSISISTPYLEKAIKLEVKNPDGKTLFTYDIPQIPKEQIDQLNKQEAANALKNKVLYPGLAIAGIVILGIGTFLAFKFIKKRRSQKPASNPAGPQPPQNFQQP